jgi:hypothetical protein
VGSCLPHDKPFLNSGCSSTIRVRRGRAVPAPPIEERRQGHFPAGVRPVAPPRRHRWECRWTPRSAPPRRARGTHGAVVEPAHRILDSDVQVPEGVLLGHPGCDVTQAGSSLKVRPGTGVPASAEACVCLRGVRSRLPRERRGAQGELERLQKTIERVLRRIVARIDCAQHAHRSTSCAWSVRP